MRKKYDIIINTLFRSDNAFSSVSLSFAKEMAKLNETDEKALSERKSVLIIISYCFLISIEIQNSLVSFG